MTGPRRRARTTTWGARGAVTALLLAVLAACTSGSPAPDPSAGPPSPADPTASPGEGETSWEDVVGARLDDEGRIPLDLALDLFAAAYGGLPGGDADAVPTPTSGSAAVRGVLAHWDELDEDQREAVAAALAPGPDVQTLATGDEGSSVHLAGFAPARTPEDAERSRVVAEVLTRVQPKVARFLGLHGDWAISWSTLPDSSESRHASADAVPYGPSGFVTSGRATTCHINLYADALDALAADMPVFESVMAHEVAHCAQFLHGDADRVLNGIEWVVEGGAEYVAASVEPSDAFDEPWQHWLGHPAYAMTRREYSGIGAFAVAEQTGADVPATVIPVLAERGSADALARLFERSADDAQKAIAQAVVRLPALGAPWESSGPAITDTRGTRDLDPRGGEARHETLIGRLGSVPVTTLVGPEVTDVQVVGGRATVGWPDGEREVADGGSARFCADGVCTCPDGLPLHGAVEVPPDARVAVAMRADVPASALVTVTTTDLETACAQVPPAGDVLVMTFTAPEEFEVHGGWCLVQDGGDLLIQAGDGRYPEGYEPPPEHRDGVAVSIYKNPTSGPEAGSVFLHVDGADVPSHSSMTYLSTDMLSGRFSTQSGWAAEWRCTEVVAADEFFAR